LPFSIQYPETLLLIVPAILIVYFVIRKDFVKFKNKTEHDLYIKRSKNPRKWVTLSRMIIFCLLIIAISSPFAIEQKTVPGDFSLTILEDKSNSFNLFKDGLGEEVKKRIEGEIPVEVRTIAYGNSSPIADALLNSIQGNDNILMITDGNNNKGKDLWDMMVFASVLNTTINTLETNPSTNDVGITIDAPQEAIYGAEISFYININKVGNPPPYKVEVTIDNDVILSEENADSLVISKSLGAGYHKVVGKLITDDFFQENNVYYKTVHVLPKPWVLFVSKESTPLEPLLEFPYVFSQKKSLPDNIDDYPVVILNNLGANDVNPWTDKLRDYVNKGNGLVVIGGKNSFDYGNYKNSYFETMLPVTIGMVGEGEKSDVNVVIVIDISGTSTLGFSPGSTSKLSIQKAQAIEILKDIDPKDNVGVIAFDTRGYYVTRKLLPLKEQPMLEQNIISLKSDPHAGTLISEGLRKAFWLLEYAPGSKNIILISDGITQIPQQAIANAKMLALRGIKLYTVGIGEDTNREFMKKLALKGNGIYFEPSETERLKLLFNESKEPPKENNLLVLDNHHFITNKLSIAANINGFNQVVPKQSARLLITSQNSNPILTTWRYGLGRIAVLATDDGSGWAGQLLNQDNSHLVSRIINWAIGDPDRKKDFSVKLEDTTLGESVDIKVFSTEVPKHPELKFSKIGENRYQSPFMPKNTGFFTFFDSTLAASYNKEYERIGINSELGDMIKITGGMQFKLENTSAIVKHVMETSKRTKFEVTYYRWPIIIAALVILLVEICIRRIKESYYR
tara:strand:- start:3268 stop:5649 length:2382 start_codon:yes stop_codon:yes gene_type:complete